MPVYESSSEEDTQKIARDLAANARPGDVFLLQGTLGAGKSVFARAFVQSLLSEQTDVPSPTFTLVQTYDSAKGAIWHFDLYRLDHAEEVFELGWEEAMAEGISLIEWPERAAPYLPQTAITVQMAVAGENQRTIEIGV